MERDQRGLTRNCKYHAEQLVQVDMFFEKYHSQSKGGDEFEVASHVVAESGS